jgi:hypothetical protein
MPRLDPYKCKSCGYVFATPKVYMSAGTKISACPFCDGKEIEKFEIVLDDRELKILDDLLEKGQPDIPPEELDKLKKKIQSMLNFVEKEEFDIRIKKAEPGA